MGLSVQQQTMSADEAPLEVTLTQSKDNVNKQISDEQKHHKRQKKNAKKRRPNWSKTKTKTNEFDESQFNDADFKNEPSAKKRKVQTIKWMQETDLFHHNLLEKETDENEKEEDNENDNDVDVENEAESEIDFEDVPQAVIDLFERAIKESKTEKELENKWKQIMDRHKLSSKHKLSAFDKVFVDGFQIEVNGVYRLNVSALKRALRMKHFKNRKHHRIPFNKKMSYGSLEPSFAFIANNTKNKKQKKYKPATFWGQKLQNMSKAVQKDQLQKWMEY